MVIATKYTTPYRTGYGDTEIIANTAGNGTKSLHTSVTQSLKKLQTDYIDLVCYASCPQSCNHKRTKLTFSIALRPLVGYVNQHPRDDAITQLPRHFW